MNLITTTSELQNFCEQIREEDADSFIAVDSEFLRIDTYRPKLCLIQVAGSKALAGIDALAKGINLKPLFEVFQDTKITKVFHAARQDLEIFYHMSKDIPQPLFDTQVAAMVCGFGESVGYDTLVREIAHANIDKSFQFTDWTRRPLSEKQMAYALQDVIHLRPVYTYLHDQLEKTQRLSWIEEEMAVLRDPKTYAVDINTVWKKIKTRSNDPRFLARVQALTIVREKEAQRLNLPRTWVIRDPLVLEIAAHPPKSLKELTEFKNIPGSVKKGDFGEEMFNALNQAENLPLEQCPTKPKRKDPTKQSALIDLIRVWLNQVSKTHKVAAKLIATTEDLTNFVAQKDLELPALKGWRYEIFGQKAEDLIHGRLGLTAKNGKIELRELI